MHNVTEQEVMYLKDIEQRNTGESVLSTRIVEAAKNLFMEHGFKGTTTKMIAEEAGVNEATLFRHFKNKEGIFLAISKEITTYGHKKLEDITESDLSPEEMLYQFGMTLYSQIVLSKGVLIVGIIESRKRSELVTNITSKLRTIVDILERKFRSMCEAGVLEENDFFTASLMYVESMIGLFVVQSRLDGELIPVEIERLCRSASKIFLHGMLKSESK